MGLTPAEGPKLHHRDEACQVQHLALHVAPVLHAAQVEQLSACKDGKVNVLATFGHADAAGLLHMVREHVFAMSAVLCCPICGVARMDCVHACTGVTSS